MTDSTGTPPVEVPSESAPQAGPGLAPQPGPQQPPEHGPAPLRWRGYPGVPLTSSPLTPGWAFGYFLYAVLVNVGVALVVVAIAVVVALASPSARQSLMGLASSTGQSTPLALTVAAGVMTLVAYLIILAPLPFIARHRKVTYAQFVGMRPVRIGAVVGLAAAVTFAGLVISVAYSGVLSVLRVHAAGNAEQIVKIFGSSPLGVVMAFVAVAVVAPIAEESAFRGVIFSSLREAWGEGWAIVVSGVLFGIIHLDPLVMIPTALLGMLLARVYSSSRSLWASIACHGTYNAVSLALALLALRAR